LAPISGKERRTGERPPRFARVINISGLETLVILQLPLLGLLANPLAAIRFSFFLVQLAWLIGLANLATYDFYLEHRLMRGLGVARLERSGHQLILALICLFSFGARPLAMAYLIGNPHWDFAGALTQLTRIEGLTFYYWFGLAGFLVLCLVAVLIPALKLQLHLAWRPRWPDALFVAACIGAVFVALLWYFAASKGSGGFLAELGQRRFDVGNLTY
jgi:hypothetical protein